MKRLWYLVDLFYFSFKEGYGKYEIYRQDFGADFFEDYLMPKPSL